MPPRRAANRLTAYVYGNILTLASVAVVTPHGIEDGTAAVIVVGAAVTTFIAHVFAELVAHSNIPDADGLSSTSARAIHMGENLRDAVPIASSAFLPATFLALGWADVMSTQWAQLLGSAVVIARIAGVQLATQRIRGNGLSLRLVVAAVVSAMIAAAIVLVKVLVTH